MENKNIKSCNNSPSVIDRDEISLETVSLNFIVIFIVYESLSKCKYRNFVLWVIKDQWEIMSKTFKVIYELFSFTFQMYVSILMQIAKVSHEWKSFSLMNN